MFHFADIMRRIFYMPACEDPPIGRGAPISGGARVGQGGDRGHSSRIWRRPAALAAVASPPKIGKKSM